MIQMSPKVFGGLEVFRTARVSTKETMSAAIWSLCRASCGSGL